jgi:hypothetical protein
MPMCRAVEKGLSKPLWVMEPVDIPQYSQMHL